MATTLKTRIVNVGNSQGVRIPKAWLDQLSLTTEVELSLESGQIVIRSPRHPRRGWEQQFREMAALKDDRMLMG